MALTRKFLTAMGIEAEKIDEIISAHSDTVTALKEDRDKYKADAEKVPSMQKELDSLRKTVEDNNDEEYKEKYEKIKKEFDDFKNDLKAKEDRTAKANAYKSLLKEVGISDKRIDSVLKVSNEIIDGLKVDSDGKIKDADKVKDSIKDEWSDFISKEGVKGADTNNPPSNNGGGKMTKEEIFKIKDASDRQKAIVENHELFGI